MTTIVCTVWVASVLPIRAQWICRSTQGATIGKGSKWYGFYRYTALSCKNNRVIVAANVNALTGNEGYYIAFLISSDGGETWNIQGNGLPTATWAHSPFIRSIDQIDSLNVIAFGDSDLLVRTTDGGSTWEKLKSPSDHFIEDISFSDPNHGVLVVEDTSQGTYTTSDGGINWVPAPFTRSFAWRCHDYGNGMYRLFEYSTGIVYTTRNDWKTVDSTGPIVSDTSTRRTFVYGNCSFEGDTIFGYGDRLNSAGYPYACIARTIDGGINWDPVYGDTTRSIWSAADNAAYMSDIGRDTILAGINESSNRVLWSSDHGDTWRLDTLLIADSNTLGMTDCFGVGYNSDGKLVAITNNNGFSPGIFIGSRRDASVDLGTLHLKFVHIFPNPAVGSITISGLVGWQRIYLMDILGRTVLNVQAPASGSLSIDGSGLARGVYLVLLEIGGISFPAGRIILD